MKILSRILIILYVLIALAHIAGQFLQQPVITYATKPLLMILLATWVYREMPDKAGRYGPIVVSALVFSLFGDVLLMFDDVSEQFFMLGLGCFLLAQLSYIGAFVNYRPGRPGLVRSKPWMAIPFLVFLVAFLSYLLPHLPMALIVPVCAYGTCLVSMSAASFNLQGVAPAPVAKRLFVGSTFFVLSDCLLALNKFMADDFPLKNASLWVMATYIIAQYLLATGAVRAGNTQNETTQPEANTDTANKT